MLSGWMGVGSKLAAAAVLVVEKEGGQSAVSVTAVAVVWGTTAEDNTAVVYTVVGYIRPVVVAAAVGNKPMGVGGYGMVGVVG